MTWLQGPVKCDKCFHEWRSVMPVKEQEFISASTINNIIVRPSIPASTTVTMPMECPQCGEMAGWLERAIGE